jgi:hypothetical protein
MRVKIADNILVCARSNLLREYWDELVRQGKRSDSLRRKKAIPRGLLNKNS